MLQVETDIYLTKVAEKKKKCVKYIISLKFPHSHISLDNNGEKKTYLNQNLIAPSLEKFNCSTKP